MHFIFGCTCLAIYLVSLCEAMRSTHVSGHLECSSMQKTPAMPKEKLQKEEQGENWNLIVIVNGYNAQRGSTTELLAANLCEASYGAENKSLIVVLESNVGRRSVEAIEAQGLRGAKEINRLLQQNRQQGRIFSGYSLVGHSLGGLVARVIAVHVDLTPRVFVSLFAPHAGVGTFVAEKVMPPLLSITGIDKGAAKEVLEQVSDKSVLMRLAQGEYLKAFMSFEKRVLYGSPADWLVDFGSAILTQINESTSGETDDEYPLLHIRNVKQQPSACDDDTVRCSVLKSMLQHAAAIERVQVDWSIFRPDKHSQKDMTPAESWELTRHLATQLGSSFALPRGSKCSVLPQDYCALGLECRRELCQPKLLRTEDCANSSDACEHLTVAINGVFERFTVIVTSSGGGGHLVAAKNLQETILEQADADLEYLEQVLSSSGHVLTPEARSQTEEALKHVRGGKPPLEMLDLMKSDCTSLGGVGFGDAMSEQWNRRQRAGDIEGLKQLVKKQPWTQIIFGHSCKRFMTNVCDGMNSHGLPVTRLYTTQPLLLESLLDACSSKVQVDLFMTDLPTTEAVHFFQPLKSLEAKLSSLWRRKFYLHSLPPPVGGREELARLSGVPPGQIYLEQFMPVNRDFTKATALPQPGEMFALKFKAQLPLEEDFLRQLGNPLLLRPEDEVILVMLGSQPTASAVEGYARASLELPKLKSKRYVLLACGKPQVEAYAKLYTDMVQLARESQGTTTVLVPFTGQDAKQMLGRADITVTRSGGLTAGELLALRTRKEDQKQMLLHVESVADTTATKILAKHLQKSEKQAAVEAAFEEAALEGMVPWEAGNARYLMKAVKAKVVIPKIFVAVVQNYSSLPFTVDWTTLLRRRGFGLDEIAFATAPPSGCEAAVCTREFDDLPLPETVAGGKAGCLDALRYFNGPSLTTIHLHADAAANRQGRLKNGHSCNGASFMVRKRRKSLGALFFKIDSAAQAVVSSCGGKITPRLRDDGATFVIRLSFGARPEAALGARHVLELFSSDDELRRKGVLELGKCGERAREVHAAAIETAKREYARRLVDMRWDELQSSDDQVRLSVLAAIEKIGPLAAPLAHDIAPLLADANIKIVEAVSKVVVNFGAIEDYLNDPNPLTRAGVQKHIVRARGRNECAEFAPHFVKALFDEDFRVRHAGSQALLELGDLAAPHVEDLAKALKDDDWYVRCNAVQAMGKVGLAAKPYLSDVATCLGDKMPEVRRQAKEVLTKLRALHAEPAEPKETAE